MSTLGTLPASADSHPPPDLPSRIPSLDGLRAVSIALVLLGHAGLAYDAPRLLQPLHHAGYLGVRFFFIISGFLITSLLLKEKYSTNRISLKYFYIRRSLRIFPASVFYLIVIGLLSYVGSLRLRPGDLLQDRKSVV